MATVDERGKAPKSELGRLRPVAENVWVVDDVLETPVRVKVPVRMTVIRLEHGDLLLYSPVKFTAGLREQLEAEGPIRYLVAPSLGHWMFIAQWQNALPTVSTFAVPRLQSRRAVKKAGVRVDRELLHETPPEWGSTLELILVSSGIYAEACIFHKPSGSLLMTDLVQHIPPEALPRGARSIARWLGVVSGDGRPPAYLRLLLHAGGRATRLAGARLIALRPERVIFAHGNFFETDATQQLKRALSWLTDRPDLEGGRPAHALRVVITGASSGIGWAAAQRFARGGARLVLAARRESVLNALAVECEALGGQALVIPTDVTDEAAVMRLAEKASAAYGGIDVWINNAGTGVYGPFHETPMALHRRTLEVNLMGSLHGAHAVLPYFIRQGRGLLINNISMGGWMPAPFAAAYTASKFALRGFTASLRQELKLHSEIKVCAVFPAMVDTPGFVHGANTSGRSLNPGPILYRPEDVAETFFNLVKRPRAEVAVGWPARAAQAAYAAAPSIAENAGGATFRFLLSRARSAPNTEGAVFQPLGPGAAASGGWLERKGLPPAGTITRIVSIGIAAVSLLALTQTVRRRRRYRG